MNTATPGARSQPFPAARPSITLAPSPDPLTTVDCPELRQWFIVPRIGERARCALYNPPDWTLSAVTDLHAVAPARVHGVEGVEIRIDEWRPAGGWTPGEWALYGRLTPDKAEYLAVILAADGERLLQTFLDEGFSDAWGQMDRTLEDRGTFVPAGESAFRLAAQPGPLRAEGSGTSIVTVEDRSFRCLRAIQLEGPLSDPRAPVTVSYITAEGRTILIRHYCHEGSTEAPTDSASRLTIDGTEFVHWYDCLTDLGCGLPGGA